MAKQLFVGTYSFDAATKTIVLEGNIRRDKFLLITNVTDNIIIYNFANPSLGFSSLTYDSDTNQTTAVLQYQTSGMSNDDVLQIFTEGIANTITVAEELLDPVNKIRVTNPQNLIDTDFEYGLQGQKWETLELVNNIPTFFARDGDFEVALETIETVDGSDVITVTTSEAHNYANGTPVIIIGTSNITCNGAFIVSNVLSTTVFQYKSKAIQSSTGDIKEEFTQLFTGSIYQGTEFDLRGLDGITTDNESPSTLTVNTEYPTNFTAGTEFYLANSLSSISQNFDASQIEGDNVEVTSFTIDPFVDENDKVNSPWKSAAPNPDVYEMVGGLTLFLPENVSVAGDGTITFSSAHNMETGHYFYGAGRGNASAFSLLAAYNYFFVRKIDNTRIRIYGDDFARNTDRFNINPGSVINDATTNYGLSYHYFHRAFLYTGTSGITGSFSSSEIANNEFELLKNTVNENFVSGFGQYLLIAGPAAEEDNRTEDLQINVAIDNRITRRPSSTAVFYNGRIQKPRSNGTFFRLIRTSPSPGLNGEIYKQNHGLEEGDGVTVDYTTRKNGNISRIRLFSLADLNRYFPYRWGGWSRSMGDGTGDTGGFTQENASSDGYLVLGAKDYEQFTGNSDADFVYDNLLYDSNQSSWTASRDYSTIWSEPVRIGMTEDIWDPQQPQFRTIRFRFKYRWGSGSNGHKRADNYNGGFGAEDGRLEILYRGAGASRSSGVLIERIDTDLEFNDWQQEQATLTLLSTSVPTEPVQFGIRWNHTGTDTDEPNLGHIGITDIEFDYTDRFYWIGNDNTGSRPDKIFQVQKIDDNYFKLQPPGGPNRRYPSMIEDSFTVTRTNALTDTDSIVSANHIFNNQTLVSYDRNGNTEISGLTDGQQYYIAQTKQNSFKLSTNESGFVGDALTIDQYAHDEGTRAVGYDIDYSVRVASGNYTNLTADGWTIGDKVLYTAPSGAALPGLVDGAQYFIRTFNRSGTMRIRFYNTEDDANNDTNPIRLSWNGANRQATLQRVAFVDIETGSGTHILSATEAGAADGVYAIGDTPDSRTFTLNTGSTINERTFALDATTIDQKNNAIYIPNHGLNQGTPLTLDTTGTPPGEMNDGSTTIFYALRLNQDYFRLAAVLDDVDTESFLQFDDLGTGINTLSTSSVTGENVAPGTIDITDGSARIIGNGTNFGAQFNVGDPFVIFIGETTSTVTVSSVNTVSDYYTVNDHGFSDGDLVRAAADTTDIDEGTMYYINASDTADPTNRFTIHSLRADAIAGNNPIDLGDTTTGNLFEIVTDIGSHIESEVGYVNKDTLMTLVDPVTQTASNLSYALNTVLLVRANGFALHRPYDGGVDLIPAQNPDGQMIRQTRKYFRYQSGKGIQISNAINFSPSIQVMQMVKETTDSSPKAIITTRFAHRLTDGLEITISGAVPTSGDDYWNGVFTVQSILSDTSFEIALLGDPVDGAAPGDIEFVVNGWTGSKVKAGLFDDQNGLFYEYDGEELYAVRRSSTLQISGVASVQNGSASLGGIGTSFISQLTVGQNVVIKGQTYQITQIDSNIQAWFMPSYRGVDADNVIVTKTVDTAVPQTEWSLDVCDGTGPTGFTLDIHKIQMAYIDYSWYGAGKVRFGFKDANGGVRYVHEFIHNNQLREAYMRSGNLPARYEIQNVGNPTFVPSLAHWGTSIIMDGRFDQDDSYVFTASANNISISGESTLTVSAKAESTSQFRIQDDNLRFRRAGFALVVETPQPSFAAMTSGMAISGADVSGHLLANPIDINNLPKTPYIPSVNSGTGGNQFTVNNESVRTLLLIDSAPTGTAGVFSDYTVTLADAATSVNVVQPLVTIRLAPSVDTGTPGFLGAREIINRMQLLLNSVQILTTHTVEVSLLLNGYLDRNDWQRVNPPSLSQLIFHEAGDTIAGGSNIYSFRAQGGSGTSNRVASDTSVNLDELVTLGNSILGGDGVFPDGPDTLSVVCRLVEDPSTVSGNNPFVVSGRISWAESQA